MTVPVRVTMVCLWLDKRCDQLKLPVRDMSGHGGHPDHRIQMVDGQASHWLIDRPTLCV